MQNRPANWETLLYDLNHKTEYKYIINGVEYTGEYVQGVATIDKPMMQQPSIGRCCTGTFSITIRQMLNTTIPKAAPVNVYCRLISDDKAVVTDWVPQGVYWITKRSGYGDLITLTCRDSMILAGRSYTDKTKITEWPAPMSDVCEEIAALMNVEIDSRSVINSGDTYRVDYPNEDFLMSEVLSMIAAAHGGNFIMTESGRLRLVPLPATSAPLFLLGGAFIDYVPYSTGEKIISRVTITDDGENVFSVGTDGGVELNGYCNYCTQLLADRIANGSYIRNGTLYANGIFDEDCAVISDNMGFISDGTATLFSEGAIGKSYLPFKISGAYFDPCIELGDTFSAEYQGKKVNLIANSISVECTQGYYCTIENGVQDDDEEEIPYVSPQELKAQRYVSTGKSYFGNRINRTEGFVSEYMVDDVAVARLIANSNLLTMQRQVNGNWENVLYFNPVDMQYHFTGEVTIDTSQFKTSSAVTDKQSIVLTADYDGKVHASTHIINVIAYTGKEPKIPTVSSVSGLPVGVTASIGTADQRTKQLPITISVSEGCNFGSSGSANGNFKIVVDAPVSMDININWAKVNTGSSGIDGTNGYNTATVMLYKRSATRVSKPQATLTYTFSTGTLTGDLDNWQREIPEGSNPCYAIFATLTSLLANAEIPSTAWSVPSVIVQDGANGTDGRDGVNSATVYLYIRAEDIPEAPTGNILYTFITAALSGEMGEWSRNIPATDGNPCWCICAQAVGQTSTITLHPSDWSDPVKLIEDGKDGDGTNTYCQSTAPNPSFLALIEGDLWIDTSDGSGGTNGDNSLYRWNGQQWVSVQDLNIPAIITVLTSAQAKLDVLDTEIKSSVDAAYVSSQLDSMIQQFNSTLTQTAQDLTATFDSSIANATGQIDTKFSAYIRASGDGIEIGRSDSKLKCILNNNRLSFVYNDSSSAKEVAYFASDQLFITKAQITDELLIGTENSEYGLFKWTRTRTGLGLKYVAANS